MHGATHDDDAELAGRHRDDAAADARHREHLRDRLDRDFRIDVARDGRLPVPADDGDAEQVLRSLYFAKAALTTAWTSFCAPTGSVATPIAIATTAARPLARTATVHG